jgi:uncharacterized protein YukE
MAKFVGADIEAMDTLERDIQRHVGQIERLGRTVSAGVAASAPIWRGTDAERFRAEWSSQHRVALLVAGTALGEMANTVARNRDAQQEASAEDDHLGDILVAAGWLATGVGAASSILANMVYGEFWPRWPAGTIINGEPFGGRYRNQSTISRWERVRAAMDDKRGWQPKRHVPNSRALRARWQTVGRWATRAGVVVSFAGGAWSQWQQTADDPSLSTGNRVGQVATVGATTAGGAYAGAIGGAQAGAFVGTLIWPGPGTVVGGIVGSAVGGFAGSYAGQWVGEQLAPLTGDLIDGIGDVAGDIGDFAGGVGGALSFWD